MEDTQDERDRRIDQLVQVVQAQQQQIEALAKAAGVKDEQLLSRRDLIRAGSATGAAALLVGASGSAAAVDGDNDTQWGTTSNRDDFLVDTLDANLVQTENLGNVIFASQKPSLQSAIDNADQGEVIILDGQFNEEITVSKPIVLKGASRNLSFSGIDADSDSDPALKITDGRVRVVGTPVRNKGTAQDILWEGVSDGSLFDSISRGGESEIDGNSSNVRVLGNVFDGNDLTVAGDNNIVIGNTDTGTISDNGAGNEIANNS